MHMLPARPFLILDLTCLQVMLLTIQCPCSLQVPMGMLLQCGRHLHTASRLPIQDSCHAPLGMARTPAILAPMARFHMHVQQRITLACPGSDVHAAFSVLCQLAHAAHLAWTVILGVNGACICVF